MAVIPECFALKNSTVRLMVSSGVVVGNFAHFEIVRAASHGADEFGASCFYSSYAWHVFQCTP